MQPNAQKRGFAPRSGPALRMVDPDERVGDHVVEALPVLEAPTAVSDHVLDLIIATLVETSDPGQRAMIISDLLEEIWSTVSWLNPIGEPSNELDSLARLVVLARAHGEDMRA